MNTTVVIRSPEARLPEKAVRLSGEVFGMLINLSGRRRFTSQRLLLYAVLASSGHPNALDTAREALRLFQDAHATLIKGNERLPGVFCAELEDAYFGSARGDQSIRDFIDLADRTLTAIQKQSSQAADLLARLIDSGTPLLGLLNRITQVYEELSSRHAAQAKKQLRSIMSDIESIAKQARMVSFNAQIVAARAGLAGREFSVVAGVLTDITGQIDGLVQQVLNDRNT